MKSPEVTLCGLWGAIIIIIIMEFIYIALVQLQQEPQAHYEENLEDSSS